MKLKTKLMLFTAATALSATMAFAAINPQALADKYVAEGYTYVEVKTGPTQTKLEAVKGNRKVEVVYDNATGEVIKSEFEDADDDYIGKSGVEIDSSNKDFEDNDNSDGDDDDSEDDDNDDDENDDDSGDDESDDDDSDNGGSGDDDEGGDDNDDNSGSDDEGDDDHGNDDSDDDNEGSED